MEEEDRSREDPPGGVLLKILQTEKIKELRSSMCFSTSKGR
jgi:hypothetical protein